MLKQRVITAIVLFAVLALVMSASSPWPFIIFIAIACGCAGWEWCRLTWPESSTLRVLIGLLLLGLTLLLSGAMIYQTSWAGSWFYLCVGLTAFVWMTAVPIAVLRGHSSAPARHAAWTLFAPLALLVACLVLISIFVNLGAVYLLTLLTVVWVADIFAYFGGKAMGKHKLAKHISPGKTIEGALTGVAGVVAWMLISAQWQGTFSSHLLMRWGWGWLILAGVALAVLSIMGDLFESLLKRRANIKDSSSLLPGHGGVLDRIDAVIVVLPFAYLMTVQPLS